MNTVLTSLARGRPLLILAVCLLVSPFMIASSQAADVPIKIGYAGTLFPIPVDYDQDGSLASVLDGQAHGTFGASMSHIATEWQLVGACDGGYGMFTLSQAAVVVTFSNDDQLFGAGAAEGWMCMHPGTGHFYGEAAGHFTGGTGRFEGASGTFTSPFEGKNLTYADFGYGFGPIEGTLTGSLSLN